MQLAVQIEREAQVALAHHNVRWNTPAFTPPLQTSGPRWHLTKIGSVQQPPSR